MSGDTPKAMANPARAKEDKERILATPNAGSKRSVLPQADCFPENLFRRRPVKLYIKVVVTEVGREVPKSHHGVADDEEDRVGDTAPGEPK